jgi:NADH:ubiquinone oxidoreductase subunit 3 (subunit A)
MITNLLLSIIHEPSAFGLLAILIYLGFMVLVVIGLIRFVKFLGSVPKEQKLLRFELGKLAEEVHKIREELKARAI